MASPTRQDPKSDSDLSERTKRAASDLSKGASEVAGDTAGSIKDTASATLSTLKDQAGQAADEAKNTISTVADEAKARVAQIVDDQKAVGADQVAGLARAAYTAAGDLRQSSPQLAKLVESAADRVDGIADDIRESNLSEILSSLAAFGRRQPVALFGGAVLAGFLLARFVKSESVTAVDMPQNRSPRRA